MLDYLLRRIPAYNEAIKSAEGYRRENDKLKHDLANLRQIEMFKGFIKPVEAYDLPDRVHRHQREAGEISHIIKE